MMHSLQDRLAEAEAQLVNRRVLVTGAAGFIGAHLVRRLAGIGARTVALDSRPVDPPAGVEAVAGDVLDPAAMASAALGCDVVFHLAGLVGVERILNVPLDVMNVHAGGTLNALRAAEKAGVRRFVMTSSSEVYGQGEGAPLSERATPAPISVYGVSKLAAEAYCSGYAQQRRLDVVRLRLFNVYGPGQAAGFAVPQFATCAVNGKAPVVYGTGEQTRAYTYVSDAVDGILLAAGLSPGGDELFNIGGRTPTSTLDLARLLVELAGSRAAPIHRALGDRTRPPEREIFHRLPDTSKAERLLGFQCRVPLREGLARCVDWYRRDQARRDARSSDAPRAEL